MALFVGEAPARWQALAARCQQLLSDPSARVWVLATPRLTLDMADHLLKATDRPVLDRVRVGSVAHAARWILEEVGGLDRPELSRLDLLLLTEHSWRSLGPARSVSLTYNAENRRRLTRLLSAMWDEETLPSSSSDPVLSLVLALLARAKSSVAATFLHPQELMSRATEGASRCHSLGDTHLLVDVCEALPRSAWRLLAQLTRFAASVDLLADTEPHGADAPFWGPVHRLESTKQPAVLGHIRSHLFAIDAPIFADDPAPALVIDISSDVRQEVEHLAADLRQWRRQGIPFDHMLVAADLAVYAPSVRQIFAEYGIPVDLPEHVPIRKHALGRLVRSILSWLQEPSAEAVQSYMKSGLTFGDSHQESVDAALLEPLRLPSGTLMIVRQWCERLVAVLEAHQVQPQLQDWEQRCRGSRHLAVLEAFYQALDSLNRTSDAAVALPDFAALVGLLLEETTLDPEPAASDAVRIRSFQEAIGSPCSVLALLGSHDGCLPLRTPPDALRTRVEEALGMKLIAEPLIGVEHLRVLCSQVLGRLRVSRPMSDAGGGEVDPSRLMEELQQLCPALRLRSRDELADAPHVRRLIALRPSDALLAGNLPTFTARNVLAPAAPLPAELRQRPPFRVTELETYRKCAFQHFMLHRLGLAETAQRLSARDRGTLLHRVLQRLVQDSIDEDWDWTAVRSEEIQRQAKAAFEQQVLQQPWAEWAQEPALAQALRTAQRVVLDAAHNLWRQVQGSSFRPLFCELGFGRGGVDPLQLGQEHGVAITVTGTIDRVDYSAAPPMVRLIDYKTNRRAHVKQDAEQGLDLQLGLYYLAFRALGTHWLGQDVAPVALLYQGLEPPLERQIDLPDDPEYKWRRLRPTGVYLGTADVVWAMDRSGATHSVLFPGGITAKGEPTKSDSALTHQELAEFGEQVRAMALVAARGILNGEVAPNPYKRKDEIPCSNCQARTACGFDPRAGDRYRSL